MFFSCVFLIALGCVTVIQAAGLNAGLNPNVCTADAKQCPDMITYVGRDSNNNCNFRPCPACVARRFDFAHQAYFEFSINNQMGVNENKALKGSGNKYKHNGEVNIALKYVFTQTDIEDNRGFRGKICFKVKGAKSKQIEYIGIPSVTCNPAPPHCFALGGGASIDLKVDITPSNKFTQHCITATGNSRIGVRLESAGGKIKVKKYYFKGCEVKN